MFCCYFALKNKKRKKKTCFFAQKLLSYCFSSYLCKRNYKIGKAKSVCRRLRITTRHHIINNFKTKNNENHQDHRCPRNPIRM